jgi:hypothetical protein
MMFTQYRRLSTLAALSVVSLTLGACALEVDEGGADAASAEQQVVGVDSFLYLRCNSTSWGLDDRSSLVATTTPGVFEVGFEVNKAYMMTVGDDCILTETPLKNSWSAGAKYYRSNVAPLTSPGTAGYSLEPAGVIKNFRVRFPAPGKYKATVDTKTKTVAFAALGQVAPGNSAWTASGQIFLDGAGTLYRIDAARTRFEKLNKASGSALWAYTSASSLSATSSCMVGGYALITEANASRIVGVSTATGAKAWTSTLGGKLSATDGYVTSMLCTPGSTYAVLSYAKPSSASYGIASINIATGATVWDLPTATYSSVSVMTKDAAIYSTVTADGNAMTFVGVSPANKNTRLFTYAGAWGLAPTVDPNGVMYGVSATALQRLFKPGTTGGWSHPFSTFSTLVNGVKVVVKADVISAVASDGVYLTAPSLNYIEKVATDTGAILWKFTDSPTGSRIVSVPGNGKVLLFTQASTGSEVTALNATTGAFMWRKTFAGAYPYPTTDKQGRIYIVRGKYLDQLDAATGNKKWTYALSSYTGYGQSSVNAVLDSDTKGVYILYSTFGYMTAPMGVASLNPATGAANWSKFDAINMYYVGSDSSRIYMEEASRGGPIAGHVYVK